MAFQSVPDTVEVNIRYTLASGVLAENTLHYKKTAYDQGDLDTLAENVDAWVDAEWLGFLNENTTYRETYVKGLNSSIDFEATNATSTGPGTGVDSGDPNETSFAVSIKSGLTGRSARGRIFMPPVPSGYKADNNHAISGYPIAIAAALYTLDASISGDGWTAVIVSRYTGGAKRTIAVTFEVASYNFSDLTLDSQRGRKPV